MHSRIFQVSTKPIEQEDYIADCEFYDHWFTRRVADYVSNDVDREDDVESLMRCIGVPDQAVLEGGCFQVTAQIKEAYFKRKFEDFINVARALFLTPFSEFMSSNCDLKVFNLNNSYCDKYGYYVYDEHSSLIPLDEFMRDIEPDATYYLGGVVDYHF